MTTKLRPLTKLHHDAYQLLSSTWDRVLSISSLDKVSDPLWGPITAEIIKNGGSTYPYVLLGQVLGKASDNELNALALQDSSTMEGARDVRRLVQRVVVPWNRTIGRPYPGANDDPYVNNPARYKNFGPEMRAKAGKKELYDQLYKVANHVQSCGQVEAERLLNVILLETRRSLEQNKRDYLGPARVSLKDVTRALEIFLKERSNGVRLQVVCYAVFRSISQAFPNFGEIRSYSTNSSDASGERAGDVERLIDGAVDFAIEVKDRTLTLNDVEGSILKARTAKVENLLFVVQAASVFEDEAGIMSRAAHEFTRGIDVNIIDATRFFDSTLILLSPEQRAELLRTVHDALHELGAHYKHVHSWMQILKSI